MKYGLTQTLTSIETSCLVLGIEAHNQVNTLDSKLHAMITPLLPKLDAEHTTYWHTTTDGLQILLVHCEQESNPEKRGKLINDIAQLLLKQRISSVTISLPPIAHQSVDQQLEHMILKFDAVCYQLLDFKTNKAKKNALKSIIFALPGATNTALKTATTIAESISFTKTLANLPANICTPTYLAEQATTLATQHDSLKTTILHQADLETLKMGAFLAVAQGSHQPPKLIEMHYHGTSKKMAPIVLVGKGITFDSGGISIKPANGMDEMKYDMAGAASVLGVLKACALLKLPIHVIGLLACAENMPGGGATRPGDIVTTMSGQTVEIVNTDAEGRLVLADALTYAEQFKPQFVIDMATLTGAVIIALGHVNTGFMTTDDALADLLQQSATKSLDAIWRLPLETAYQDSLDSPLADMVNSTFDRSAGSVTAACFLSRFTKKFRWAHLDIAGTAWVSGRKNHATGRPVPLLIELLRHVADSR